MKTSLKLTSKLIPLFALFVSAAHGSVYLIDVDYFGNASVTSKSGIAAIGTSASDFWNSYTRDDGHGGWRTLGTVSNLKLADGTSTSVSMTVANMPGYWSVASPDPMYAGYIYPFSGNGTVTITGLPIGQYDVYAYTADGSCEVTVGALSYGIKTTYDPSATSTPVWTDGVQYAHFGNVALNGSQPLVLTTRNGAVGGVPIISGLQIVAVPEPTSAALFVGCLVSGLFFRRASRQIQ